MKKLLLVSHESEAVGQLLDGMCSFLEEHPDITLRAIDPRQSNRRKRLSAYNPDLVLLHGAHADYDFVLDWCKRTRTPTLQLGNCEGVRTDSIHFDDEMVGRCAAEHLLERKFTNFAFSGGTGDYATLQRLNGFRKRVEAEGYTCELVSIESSLSLWLSHDTPILLSKLQAGIEGLPKPCGVLCYLPDAAYGFVRTCLKAGFSIPDDIAVVSAGDSLLLEQSSPSITAIHLDYHKQGYELAELAYRRLFRPSSRRKRIVHAPDLIRARDSTRIIAPESQIISKSLLFINQNIGHPISIEDLTKQCGCSRSMLYQEFREQLSASPLRVISSRKLDRASSLLLETNRSVAEIATACGFADPYYFSRFFKKHSGKSPAAYRNLNKSV